jgi:TonB family protein
MRNPWALLASGLAHFALLLFVFWPQEVPRQAPHKEVPLVDIGQVPNYVVETEKAGIPKVSKNARLAERNQTVREETKAAHVGKFADAKNHQRNIEDKLSLRDLGLGVGMTDYQEAATDDALDKIRTDKRTALDTREFKYIGFYERVKRQLRIYWSPQVVEKALSLMTSGQNIMGTQALVTRLTVSLDTQGRIVKILTTQKSGVDEIDEVAIAAFQQAGQFPNPPAGMRETDGLIRLRWDFVLTPNHMPKMKLAGNVPLDKTRRIY